jgi:ubiquinone/menaquinone biosynthesis C-methylase UbiE
MGVPREVCTHQLDGGAEEARVRQLGATVVEDPSTVRDLKLAGELLEPRGQPAHVVRVAVPWRRPAQVGGTLRLEQCAAGVVPSEIAARQSSRLLGARRGARGLRSARMADVEANLEVWEEGWDWSAGGEEWSASWGGTRALWHAVLLPRLHVFVPTGTILEVAPGHGRWTQFLKDLCERLVVVDLSEHCIEHCRRRFADAANIEYHVNDGRSLGMVPDRSVDLAFSFDSLVHVDSDVLGAYLDELARTLKPDGIGWLHHSVAGDYGRLNALSRRMPERLRRPLVHRGVLLDAYAWRAEDVTSERFAASCERVGLACPSQERITWEWGPYLTDAISLVTPRGSRWDRPPRRSRNFLFRRDTRRVAWLYGETGR